MSLIASIAVLGLASCSDRTPLRPFVGFGPGPSPLPAPTPPTPAPPSGPADSLLEANRSVYDANLGYPTETFIDYAANAVDDELGFRIFGLSPLQRE